MSFLLTILSIFKNSYYFLYFIDIIYYSVFYTIFHCNLRIWFLSEKSLIEYTYWVIGLWGFLFLKRLKVFFNIIIFTFWSFWLFIFSTFFNLFLRDSFLQCINIYFVQSKFLFSFYCSFQMSRAFFLFSYL